ncbi:MAG: DUF3616 domain-containing protein [Proteobacteria bacterium]|nr:DUF3616 domain-containing protein [Pseudomonadota bacterium]
MRHVFHALALGSALCGVTTGPSAAQEIANVQKLGPFVGTCMASAVVTYPAGTVDQFMIVGNDEKNVLQTYRVTGGESKVLKAANINPFLGLDDAAGKGKADIEAATTLDGQAIWIGSHSRNSEGELRPARGQLFSTAIVLEEGVPVAKPSQKVPQNRLLEAFAALDPLRDIIALHDHKNADKAAKKQGFNIEGLSLGEDGTSLVVGLRGPLSDNKAYVLTISDAAGLLRTGSLAPGAVKLRATLTFAAGKGIRSMEYAPARKAFFVIAGSSGPDDDRPAFDLYLWDGGSGPPTLIPGLRDRIEAAGLPRFQPEALAVDSTGTRLLVLSDDENRCKDDAFNGVLVTLK